MTTTESTELTVTMPITESEKPGFAEKQAALDAASKAAFHASGVTATSSEDDQHLETSLGSGEKPKAPEKKEVETEVKPEWIQEGEWKGTLKATLEAMRSAKHFEKKAEEKGKKTLEAKPAAEAPLPISELFSEESQAAFKADLAKNNGALSEESYARIQKTGLPKEAIDIYMAGFNAELTKNVTIATEVMGGKEEYAKKTAWFAELPMEQQQILGPGLQSPNAATVRAAAEAIDALYEKANGRDLRLQTGGGTSVATEGVQNRFRNQAHQNNAFNHPLYTRMTPEGDEYRAWLMGMIQNTKQHGFTNP